MGNLSEAADRAVAVAEASAVAHDVHDIATELAALVHGLADVAGARTVHDLEHHRSHND